MKIIEGYTYIKKLGSGATSDVYLAKDSLGQLKALKVFNQMLPEELGIKTFTRELKNLKAVKNEKIVKVFDLKKNSDGVFVLIQEYIDGINLKDRLYSISCPIERLVASLVVTSEILSALEECHKKGIIHRDIKPENILLDKTGRIVITDFGLSKNLKKLDKSLHGNLFGSPQYMSLLQFSNEEPSEKIDIYSIAVLFYEILTGHKVFSGDNLEEILHQKRDSLFKSARKLNYYSPAQICNALRSILSNDFSNYEKSYKLRYLVLGFIDVLNIDVDQVITKLCSQQTLLEGTEKENIKTLIELNLNKTYEQTKNLEKKEALLSQLIKINPEKYSWAPKPKINKRVLFPLLATASLVLSVFIYKNINISDKLPSVAGTKSSISANVSPVLGKASNSLKKVPAIKTKKIKPQSKVKKAQNKSVLIKNKPKQKPQVKTKKVVKKRRINKKRESVKVIGSMKSGFLIVNVPSDIKVYINNKRILQIGKRLSLPVGKYNIVLSKVGYDPITSVISVDENKDTLINLD